MRQSWSNPYNRLPHKWYRIYCRKCQRHVSLPHLSISFLIFFNIVGFVQMTWASLWYHCLLTKKGLSSMTSQACLRLCDITEDWVSSYLCNRTDSWVVWDKGCAQLLSRLLWVDSVMCKRTLLTTGYIYRFWFILRHYWPPRRLQ